MQYITRCKKDGIHGSLTIYGYLNELAHGLFYLVFAPAFVWLGCNFVVSAHNALAALQQHGRLRCRDANINAVEIMRARNRKWFRWIALLPIPITLAINLPTELSSYFAVANGTSHDLGYI